MIEEVTKSDIAKYAVTYAVLLPGNSMHLVHIPLLDLGRYFTSLDMNTFLSVSMNN